MKLDAICVETPARCTCAQVHVAVRLDGGTVVCGKLPPHAARVLADQLTRAADALARRTPGEPS